MRGSIEDVARSEMGANAKEIELSLWDGMGAAANEAWRAGATSAVDRGIKNFLDDSEEIDFNIANEEYGLAGTSAEIKPDEKVTRKDVEARVKDFHQLKMNEFITNTVNQDAPIMGRLSQFVAGMGASMVDPVMMAANVAGTGVIAKAGETISKGGRALNAITKMNPAVANSIVAAYEVGGNRSLMSIIAREGMENFAGSVIEESIIQTADLGQERLARKISFQESLHNVVAGTVFGAGLGTVMTKEGRASIARSFARDFGDDAGEMAKSTHLMSSEEARLGVEKSGIENKFYDRESFEARPWYNEAPYQMGDGVPQKLYVSLDENGAIHSYSSRGNGVTLTGNKIHAYNKGAKIYEIDPSNLRLLDNTDFIDAKGRQTKVAARVASDLIDDIVAKSDPTITGKILHLLKDSDADIDDMRFNRNQIRRMLNEEMSNKNLDEMIALVDSISSRHQLDYDPAVRLEEVVNELGFNGYTFTGKSAQGNPAYKGVYVNENFTRKLKKTAEYETPKPAEGDALLWRRHEERMMHDHANWLTTQARSIQGDIRDPQHVGIPSQTPVENAPKTAEGEALLGSVEKQQSFQTVKSKLEAEANRKIEEAKSKAIPKEGEEAPDVDIEDVIDPETATTLKIMEQLQKGADQESIVKTVMDSVSNWINCRIGG